MSSSRELKQMLAGIELTVIGVGLCLFFRPDVLLVGVGATMSLVGLFVVLLRTLSSSD